MRWPGSIIFMRLTHVEYNETVMSHFLNPRNTGDIPDATCRATVVNSLCGDVIKLSLKIEQGVICDAKAKTYGCAAAIASASVLTELLTGKSVADAAAIRNADVVRALGGLPEEKIRCSLSAEEVVQKTLVGYNGRSPDGKSLKEVH